MKNRLILQQRIRRFPRTIKQFLAILLAYLTIAGISTFTQFILEESIQTTMFGTWQTKNDPDTKFMGLNLMTKINDRLEFVNKWLGWLHPIALMSYRSYAKATDFYIQAGYSQLLIEHPEAILGRTISFTFTWNEVERFDGYSVLRAGKMLVRVKEPPKTNPARITGTVIGMSSKVLIEASHVEDK